MSSEDITITSPVKPDYLKVSAQLRPAGPPPIITYLVLLSGSLFDNLSWF